MADARDEIAAGERFAFGENWAQFLELVDDDRITAAEQSLRAKLGDLAGVTFVDAGCGSGLFSLAARNLGARVLSFDFDPQSVACTQALRETYWPADPDWRVELGSVLDRAYLARLGQFDVVYSWGVLHHTGRMWIALDNAAQLVAPGGRMLVALYNDQGLISRYWSLVKRSYVRSGTAGRAVILAVVGGFLRGRGRLIDIVKRRPAMPRRGMDRRRDVVDWIGGWPFEVSTPAQVVDFYRARGFRVEHAWTVGRRMGNNEYLAVRPGSQLATAR